jgi:hypothetical protein
MPLPKEDIEQIRQERIERARHQSEPYSIDAFLDPFADLTDEFMAEALPPFVDAMERMEALLVGRGELFAGEIGAEGSRLWSEIETVQEARHRHQRALLPSSAGPGSLRTAAPDDPHRDASP